MINVIASVHLKKGVFPQFIKIFKANIPAVLAEKGCVAYAPTVDVPTDLPPQVCDPDVVTIIEKWESLQDLKTHLTAPHMLKYREKVSDMVEKVVLKILTEA